MKNGSEEQICTRAHALINSEVIDEINIVSGHIIQPSVVSLVYLSHSKYAVDCLLSVQEAAVGPA